MTTGEAGMSNHNCISKSYSLWHELSRIQFIATLQLTSAEYVWLLLTVLGTSTLQYLYDAYIDLRDTPGADLI
jgi:hypothetical protein